MSTEEFRHLLSRGIAAAEGGNTLVALIHLEEALRSGQNPLIGSYLGYCLARERNQLKRGLALCQQALQADPANSVHYLNLGRVYLLAGQKNQAVITFRRALKLGRHPAILNELKRLGLRKEPVLAGLNRAHPINKYLGMIFQRLGLR